MNTDAVIAAVGVIFASTSLTAAVFMYRRSYAVRSSPRSPGLIASTQEIPRTEQHVFRLDPPDASPCRVGIITGNIRRVTQADIWVNGENTDMEMARITENSVSAVIRYLGSERDAAGRVTTDVVADALRSVVGGKTPVAPCSAFVTPAGALEASNNVHYVIHVAAVQGEPGSGFHQVRNIGQCVTNALNEAENLEVADTKGLSILFPLLGTGTGRAEVRSTVVTMLGATVNYLDVTPNTKLRTIYFLAYTDQALKTLLSEIRALPRLVPANPTS